MNCLKDQKNFDIVLCNSFEIVEICSSEKQIDIKF